MSHLSPRQQQIVTERLSGALWKEVADRCGMSLNTVKHHQAIAFRRLGVVSSMQLALLAREESWPTNAPRA